MVGKAHINRFAKQSSGDKRVITADADIPDIVNTILMGDKESRAFAFDFANRLKGRTVRDTLKNIWGFTKNNVDYVRDNPGSEVVKSAARTLKDKFGDCKSMSILNGAIMYHLGIPYKYRVSFYDEEKEQGHIYPIAMVNGQEIFVDSVVDYFDYQVTPAFYTDYYPSGKSLSGISQNNNWLAPVAIIGLMLWLQN